MKTPRTVHLAVLAMYLAAASGSRVCADSLSAERISDLFSQAKELFRKANDLTASDPGTAHDLYHKAAMRFERIAHEGQVRNGKLYYNIGNAYFRMGDIGRAVLYYRRAALLIPNDENLHQNLNYAKSKCVDKIEEKQQAKVFRTLFFWHYDLSSRVRLYIFAATFAMLWIAASVRLLRRWLSPRWAIAILAVVTALFSGSLLVETLTAGNTVSGVVLAPEVVARKGDGAGGRTKVLVAGEGGRHCPEVGYLGRDKKLMSVIWRLPLPVQWTTAGLLEQGIDNVQCPTHECVSEKAGDLY